MKLEGGVGVKTIALLALVLTSGLILTANRVQAQELPLLFVEQDEARLERQIARYLDDRTDWNVRLEEFNGLAGDMYLIVRVPIDGQNRDVFVDTLESARNGAERRIRIYGFVSMRIDEDNRRRREALEIINSYANDNWGPRLMLDDEGDLAFDWNINIPGNDSPIHAEQVYDAVYRVKIALEGIIPIFRQNGFNIN